MSNPSTTSLRYVRVKLRSVFSLIEKYLNPVVKATAQQRPEWTDTWFEELQKCVGTKMQHHMSRDNEWDVYTLCMILKRHFRKAFFPSIEDESLVDRLFMCIHTLGCTRDYLSHNGNPSSSEMTYCMEACVEIVKYLPPPASLTLDPSLPLRELRTTIENCNLALSLASDHVTEMVLVESEYYLDRLDGMFSFVESDFGQRFHEAGIRNESMDVQKIIKTLLNLPTDRRIKDILKQRATAKVKAKKIDIDESRLDDICSRPEEEKVTIIEKLLMDRVITTAQAESLRIELQEGKNPVLTKVTPEDVKIIHYIDLACLFEIIITI